MVIQGAPHRPTVPTPVIEPFRLYYEAYFWFLVKVIHVVRVWRQLINEEGTDADDWPSHSLDMKLIKNLSWATWNEPDQPVISVFNIDFFGVILFLRDSQSE